MIPIDLQDYKVDITNSLMNDLQGSFNLLIDKTVRYIVYFDFEALSCLFSNVIMRKIDYLMIRTPGI